MVIVYINISVVNVKGVVSFWLSFRNIIVLFVVISNNVRGLILNLVML